MKISLNWLTEYIDVSLSVHDLAELFTQTGLNCDGIIETDTDLVLDLEVTSNRPDLLGHLGVARELSAATGVPLRMPPIGELPMQGRVEELTSVQVEQADLCPRYTARVIRGVKVGPSPRWMVERLEAVGVRSVNNVVDVTNFVMMEYSQPLHSFDYDQLHERRIVVRRALGGETMVAIDGTDCRLDESMLVIADARRAVAVAGVMGGLATEVGEKTVNILLEAAQFDPLCIRHTSRKLGLMSESNYRFERGIDPVMLDEASRRACQLIVATAGGQLAEGVADVWAKPWQAGSVTLRPQRTTALLGVELPAGRQAEILEGLGLSPRQVDGQIVCAIPSWRRDLTREVDLIEEVARVHGYDQIPVGGEVRHAVRSEAMPQRVRKLVGRILTAAGFDESLGFNFIDDAEAALFGVAEPIRVDPRVRRSNNALRPSLLPVLLRACKVNQDAGNAEVNLFELAAVFPPGSQTVADEHMQVGLVTTRDLRDLRGALEAMFAQVTPESRLQIAPGAAPGLAEGSSAGIVLDGEPIGAIGIVAADVQSHYGLEKAVAAATVRFDVLLAKAQLERRYVPLPRYPGVERDLSVIVDEGVTWAQLAETIASVAQPLRQDVRYVTTYRGKPVPAGRKSVTVRLVYRWMEGTLRREQVDEQVAQLLDALARDLAAELRT